MQRRNFLQALMAAAAGLTVAARPATAKPPRVTIGADTTQFASRLDETQRTLVEMLKECRVTQWSRDTLVSGGAETWTITYHHAPNASRTSLDDEADAASRGRVPRSVIVTHISSSFDISDPDEFGHYGLVPSFDKGDYEIEVEWI